MDTTFSGKKKRLSIRFTVVTLLLIALSLIAGVILTLQYHFAKDLAVKSANANIASMVQKIQTEVSSFDKSNSKTAGLLSKCSLLRERGFNFLNF